MLCLLPAEGIAQPLDVRLQKERDRLLVKYAEFKSYSSSNPQDVYGGLTHDRQAVFAAILHAIFVELEDSSGRGSGTRVIDYLDEVRGIWGVRPGERDGKKQFRLSVRWRVGLINALSNSDNIRKSINGHVLMPVAKGGDDEPQFKSFDIRDKDVVTYRQTGRPSVQVSFLSADPTIGEIDVDYDPRGVVACGCHCKPSNSDIGSYDTDVTKHHVHLKDFKDTMPFFSTPLSLTWTNSTAHCQDCY